MGSVSWPRRPMELTQHRRNGCVTCMVGQILYVFRLTDSPNLPAIDALMGYAQDDREVQDWDARFHLLQHGLGYRSFTTFDQARFVREGLAYFRSWHGKRWTPAHTAYFTPARITGLQHEARLAEMRSRPFSRQFEWTPRLPTPTDVEALLRQGCVLDVTTAAKVGSVLLHAGVIVPQREYPDASRVWFYSPLFGGKTVTSVKLDVLLARLVWDEGVTAFWR